MLMVFQADSEENLLQFGWTGVGLSGSELLLRAAEETGAVTDEMLSKTMAVCNSIILASTMEDTPSARDQV